MPIDCQRSTSGGKGNFGKFIERDPRICAAGIPSAQPDNDVKGALQCYLLTDEVQALVGDAILPPPTPKPLPPLRHPIPIDTRHSILTEVAQLINPPIKTKFQTLVEDFKDTVYVSYWKRVIGGLPDPVPMMPQGFDVTGTTYGRKSPYQERLYDIVMPKVPDPDMTPRSQQPGVQTERKYCAPPFDSNLTYGHRAGIDKRGIYVKCCLTDDRIVGGNSNTIVNSRQANFQHAYQPRSGTVLAPYDNITCVPEGYSFGILKPPDNLPECLSTCELNPGRNEFKNCLKALNTLRKVLSTRFLPSFFNSLYLSFKYFDKNKTGWIPKNVVYNLCATKFIRFDPALIEPLLTMWSAFDGTNIKYETFIRVLNYKETSPELPKVPDIPDDCINFETTYRAMVKDVNKEPDLSPMAGVPSGRYFDRDYPVTPDGYCKADRTYLLHESDMKSCLSPSVLTQLQVNHRDMYEKREPDVVRRVFEAAYGKFTDEQFNTYWEAAKTYHTEGWVCYQTFRNALEELTNPSSPEQEQKKDHH